MKHAVRPGFSTRAARSRAGFLLTCSTFLVVALLVIAPHAAEAAPDDPGDGTTDVVATTPNPDAITPGAPGDESRPPGSATAEERKASFVLDECDGSKEVDPEHQSTAFGGVAAYVGCGAVANQQLVLRKLGYGDPGASTANRLNFDGSGEGGKWFLMNYNLMKRIGLSAVVPLLILGTINAIFSRSLVMLFRVYLIGIPVALIGTVVMMAFIQLLANITDDLSEPFVNATRSDATQFFRVLTQGFGATGAGAGVNMLAQIFFGLLIALVSIFLYFILMMRDASVYLTAVFMPLGLALFIWPATAKYFVRMFQFVVAMILSKFVMVATLSLGFAALAGDVSGELAQPQLDLADNSNMVNPEEAAEQEKFAVGQWYFVVGENALLFLLVALAPNATAKTLMSVGFGDAGGSIPGALSRPGVMVKAVGLNRAREIFRYSVTEPRHSRRQKKIRKERARHTSENRERLAELGIKDFGAREISDDPMVDLFKAGIPDEELDRHGWGKDDSRTAEEQEAVDRQRQMLIDWSHSDNQNLWVASQTILREGQDNVMGFGIFGDGGAGSDGLGSRVEIQTAERRMIIMDNFDKNGKIIEGVDVAQIDQLMRAHHAIGNRQLDLVIPVRATYDAQGNLAFKEGHFTRRNTNVNAVSHRNVKDRIDAFNARYNAKMPRVRLVYAPNPSLGGVVDGAQGIEGTSERRFWG